MEHSVCFIGHRKINDTPQLRKRLRQVLSQLIESGTVNFIFGDRSEFDKLCYDSVTQLRELYPQIRRIKFRKDYENTNEYTMKLLSYGYEESICPKGIDSAGRACYAERNQAMILESDICIFYYDKSYFPSRRKYAKNCLNDYQPKSGTAIAYQYAVKSKKTIINCFFKENI